MKHPDRNEWVPYLFGEADAESERELAAHLQGCPECAAEVDGWRRSMKKLDAWKAPRRRSPVGMYFATLKWAAAAVVLSIGVAAGRWSSPPPDVRALRTELEASFKSALVSDVRQELGRELNSDLQSVLAACTRMTNEFRQHLDRDLERIAAAALEASSQETQRAFNKLTQTIRNAREEDREAMLTLVRQLEERHAADYLSLRKDLETVASLADDEIRRARRTILQFAADNAQSDHLP